MQASWFPLGCFLLALLLAATTRMDRSRTMYLGCPFGHTQFLRLALLLSASCCGVPAEGELGDHSAESHLWLSRMISLLSSGQAGPFASMQSMKSSVEPGCAYYFVYRTHKSLPPRPPSSPWSLQDPIPPSQSTRSGTRKAAWTFLLPLVCESTHRSAGEGSLLVSSLSWTTYRKLGLQL